jgi:hypothetical protein
VSLKRRTGLEPATSSLGNRGSDGAKYLQNGAFGSARRVLYRKATAESQIAVRVSGRPSRVSQPTTRGVNPRSTTPIDRGTESVPACCRGAGADRRAADRCQGKRHPGAIAEYERFHVRACPPAGALNARGGSRARCLRAHPAPLHHFRADRLPPSTGRPLPHTPGGHRRVLAQAYPAARAERAPHATRGSPAASTPGA